MIRRLLVSAVVLSSLSWFSAPAAEGQPVAPPDPFPRLEALRPNVEFWTRVFGEWSLGQVVFHDMDHPGLIYEILDLPGPIGETYTEQQQDWVASVRESWEGYLHALEQKVKSGAPLDELDKSWTLHIANTVGLDKLDQAHARVRSQRGLRERFRAGLERSSRLDRRIREIMRASGLPEDLAYLPHVESSFQYHAESSAGARGLWQFTRGTGRQYLNITAAIDERIDPIAATHAAAAYLSEAYAQLESWPLALTSYNHGVGGMLRAKKEFGTDFEKIVHHYDGRSFGFASKNFYAEFLAVREIASNPERYFPEGYTPEPEFDLDKVVLETRATVTGLAAKYGLPVDELAGLNSAWSSRAVKHGLHLPIGSAVWLPRGTLERVSQQTNGAPAATGSDGGVYTVKPGDTLSGIARAHGVSLGDLERANDLDGTDAVIRPGQTLRVAGGAEPRRHVVQRGDTLGHIATSYGVHLADLLSANMLNPRSILRPGQVLSIPH